MWFGEPGHCLVYKLMLPALAVATFGDLMISVGMMALGAESTRMGKGKKRCAALKCSWGQRGIVVCIVFNLVMYIGVW